MKFPTDPYVYVLLNEAGLPFYVGKGRGRRAINHLAQAKRGDKGPRFDVIRAMLDAGHEYRFKIVSTHDTDIEAAQAEKALIASMPGLTNQTAGGEIGGTRQNPRDILSARSAAILQRLVDAGRGDHPLADILRSEVANPSYNMATWDPVKGLKFGWHCDQAPRIPERLTAYA